MKKKEFERRCQNISFDKNFERIQFQQFPTSATMPEAENVNRYIIYKPTRKYNEFANKVKCSATSEMHMIFEAWLVHR